MRDGFTCSCNEGFYDLNLDNPGRKCAQDLPCCKTMEIGVANHPHYNAICEVARTQDNGFIDYRNCFTNLTLDESLYDLYLTFRIGSETGSAVEQILILVITGGIFQCLYNMLV